MSKQKYAFTLKYIKHQSLWAEDDYMVAITTMEKAYKAVVLDYRFEQDSLNRLHCHGTMLARKGLRYTLFKITYLHVHIDPLLTLADEINWDKYINKDMYLDYCFQNDDQILDDNIKSQMNKYLRNPEGSGAPPPVLHQENTLDITI